MASTRHAMLAVVSFINILQADFATIFLPKNLQIQTVIREKLHKTLSFKKVTLKC